MSGFEFEDFMDDLFGSYSDSPFTKENILAIQLDNLWREYKMAEYTTRCNNIKADGYRIFRNNQGKHKVMR